MEASDDDNEETQFTASMSFNNNQFSNLKQFTAVTNHHRPLSTPASPQRASNAIVNDSEPTQYSASLFEQSFEHSEGETALLQFTAGQVQYLQPISSTKTMNWLISPISNVSLYLLIVGE
jgi:hypothetical protein